MTTVVKTPRRIQDATWLGGLGALVFIGLIAWVVQLSRGFEVTGVGQYIVWGVYIATFFTLAGASAGLVILSVLAQYGFIAAPEQYRRPMLIGALAGFIASGVMILIDIGRPSRVLNIIFSTNVTSPFVWDFALLALTVIVVATYLYLAPRQKWMGILAAVLAALVVIVEGLILSMSAAGVFWHGGLMPAIFLAEGVLAATAVMLLLESNTGLITPLKRLAILLLATVAILNSFELASVAYAGQPDAQSAISLLVSGRLAPLFWLVVIFGIVAPLVLLVAGTQRAAVIAAATLALLGVFASKLQVLVAGQALAYMQPAARYTPTWIEIGGVAGGIGLAGLLFILIRNTVKEG